MSPSSRSTSFFIAALAVVLAGACLMLVPGCGNSVNALSDGGPGSGGYGGNFVDAGKIPIGQTQCSDGIDNDGDGYTDAADWECNVVLDPGE